MSKIVLIGADPAQRMNGIAFGVVDEGLNPSLADVQLVSFNGIENLLRQRAFLEFCEEHRDLMCYAAIECPTWPGNGTKEVRSAGMVYERELHRAFPFRRVYKVDPRQWQSLLLSGVTALGTKSASMMRANLHGLECKNDHEADALCLLEYAAMIAGGAISAEERKGGRKKPAGRRR